MVGGADCGGAAGTGYGPVTVDDAAVFFGRLESGALAAFEASRFALGRKNAMRFEINGTQGSLAFDFENMNVLEHYDARRRPTPPGSPGSWSPNRRIRICPPGGHPATAWATSTDSPTR